jgi:tellurite resistance-related uncharacterized protein
MPPEPYKSTPEFTQDTLPAAIRGAHATKAGVWGLLRVLEGGATLVFHAPPRSVMVTPDAPVVITPEAEHHVETDGPVRMRVEFYREPPLG